MSAARNSGAGRFLFGNNPREGDVNIALQADNVFGDVSYVVGEKATSEDKFAVAKNYVAGARLRSAEELIREVVAAGDFVSPAKACSLANEVAYYWTLAVLGDRSFELLDREQFGQLAQARELSRHGPPDHWKEAQDVLTDLVDCLRSQERSGALSKERLDAFFDRFGRLDEAHREEIRRHLDLILSGVFQDRLAANDAETVRQKRMGDGRVDRVWKFFEPVPAKPREVPVCWPAPSLLQWTMTIWGALMTVAGTIVAAILVTSVSWKAALGWGVLVPLSGALVGSVVPGLLPVRYAPSPGSDPKGHRGRRWSPERDRFAAHVRWTVQRQYDLRGPGAPLLRPLWAAATRQGRSRLATEIIEVYADYWSAPRRVDWLIAWHAAKDHRAWAATDAGNQKRALRFAALAAGALGTVVAWYIAVPRMQSAEPLIANIALAWLILGVALLVAGRGDVRLVRRLTHDVWLAASSERYTAEKEAYELRKSLLADRPSDAQMARWLDFDKLYLKSLAMHQYSLTNAEIVAHAFLVEAAPKCRRGRVSNGPPRYSAYTLWVFLLTDSGVRQMAVHLDFPTGIVKDQQRTAFRYDMLAAAEITEFGMRFDDGRRERLLPRSGSDETEREDRAEHEGERVDPPEGRRVDEKRGDKSSLVFFQVFRLSLISGESITITVENVEEWLLRRAGESRNAAPSEAPDTSDLTGAIGILEAVAADGGAWITRARRRRHAAGSDAFSEPA